MNYKHSCVIDADFIYKTLVLVLLIQADRGQEWKVQNYTLSDGERLIDADPPTMRPYAGAAGFIRPKWDTDTAGWVEAATAEEIAAWEAEHPAPETPEPAPTVEELQAKITALTTSNQMLEDCIIEMAGVIYA